MESNIYKSNVAKLLVLPAEFEEIKLEIPTILMAHPASAVAKAEPKAAAIKVGASPYYSKGHRLERIGTYVLADSSFHIRWWPRGYRFICG